MARTFKMSELGEQLKSAYTREWFGETLTTKEDAMGAKYMGKINLTGMAGWLPPPTAQSGETWILADCGCVGTVGNGSMAAENTYRLAATVPCKYGQDAHHYALDPEMRGAQLVTRPCVPGLASAEAIRANVEAQDRASTPKLPPLPPGFMEEILRLSAEIAKSQANQVSPQWLVTDPPKAPDPQPYPSVDDWDLLPDA